MTFQLHEIVWTAEKSKRLWDYYGSNPHYRATFFGHIAGPFLAAKIKSWVKFSDDARILDLGCGPGDVIAALLPLLKHRQEIYASDFSSTYINAVNTRFASDRHFKGATLITTLPSELPGAYFDFILATEVIEHLNDSELDGLLAESRRLLKQGGQVLFTTPNQEDYDASKLLCPECGCIYHKWQHQRTWTADTLHRRMERSGLSTRMIKPVAWQSWRGKLLSLLVRGKIDRNGLVYLGERT